MASAETKSNQKVAVIVGAGSKYVRKNMDAEESAWTRFGLGGALSLRFSQEYIVVLMGRDVEVLNMVKAEVEKADGEAVAVRCDVTDSKLVEEAFSKAKEVGEIEVFIFNAGPPFPPGKNFINLPPPHEVDADWLQKAFNIGVSGCVRCVQQVAPAMLERGSGSIILSGATMALRGGANFSCMSPVKFALRSYGQSMFQAYAKQGVHVAHVIIDGVINSPKTREMVGGKFAMQEPKELADAYMMLAKQPRTCWSFELQLTPNDQNVGMRM